MVTTITSTVVPDVIPVEVDSQGHVDWWIPCGRGSSDCIGAWQAIGAASYAASKVNIANPGTYNLGEGPSFPTWNATDGWVCDGTQYLIIGNFDNLNATMTLICRFSDATSTGTDALILGGYDGEFVGLTPNVANVVRRYYSGNMNQIASPVSSGVMAMAGGNCYLDGVPDGTFSAVNTSPNNYGIGASGIGLLYYIGKIQAAAMYNIVLSWEEILETSIAMADL